MKDEENATVQLRSEDRWTARPRLALAVRTMVLLVPIAASFWVALLTQRWCDDLFPDAPWLVGAVISLGTAMFTLIVGERVARRFMPLAMLLKLALLFPDQVPNRFSIALRAASPRRLADQLQSDDGEVVTAAERVLALVSALAAHDRLTRGHSERVRAVTMLIADEMGITGADRDKLEWAALLHDVGKMTVSPAILNKRGAPDDEEWAELRTHPGNGAPLAGELAGWMGDWVHAIDQHHERFDGSGYPLGLAGDEISQGARIVSAADAFEVMTAVRSYKKAMRVSDARAELAACTGTHFDPVIVRSFASLSLAKLHRALGPGSWAMSLPFRGAVTQAIKGAGALVGGSATSAVAGLAGAFVVAAASVSMADAVDGRFDSHVNASDNETSMSVDVLPGASEDTEPEDPAAALADEAITPDKDTASEPGDDPGDPGEEQESDTGEDDQDADEPGTGQASDPVGAVPVVDFNSLTEEQLATLGEALEISLDDLTEDELQVVAELIDAAGVLPAFVTEGAAEVTDLIDIVSAELAALGVMSDMQTTAGLAQVGQDAAGNVVDAADDIVDGLGDAATAIPLPSTGVLQPATIPSVPAVTAVLPVPSVVPVPTVPPVPTFVPVAVPTAIPVATAIPAATAVPAATVPPVATAFPVATAPSVATAVPVATVPPVLTVVPVATVPPVATALPVATAPAPIPTVVIAVGDGG